MLSSKEQVTRSAAIWSWAAIVLLALLTLTACVRSDPNVRADAEAYAQEHIGDRLTAEVLTYAVGEGDAESRYYVVQMRLTAQESLRMSTGPFNGLMLEQGVAEEVSLEMLYQHGDHGWSLGNVAATWKSKR